MILPNQRCRSGVDILTTFEISQGPRQPVIVSCTVFNSLRSFHELLSHSNGTSGLPLSVRPQQHPEHTKTCPRTTRWVVGPATMIPLISIAFKIHDTPFEPPNLGLFTSFPLGFVKQGDECGTLQRAFRQRNSSSHRPSVQIFSISFLKLYACSERPVQRSSILKNFQAPNEIPHTRTNNAARM